MIDHIDAPSQEHELHHGQGENHTHTLGKSKNSALEKVKLVKTHPHMTIVQYADEQSQTCHKPADCESASEGL